MISIIAPTYNGAQTLPLMLNALIQVDIPPGGCEYIFIDNASKDNSAEIIRSYSSQLPITLVQESKQGKNFAVAAGLKAAKGSLFLFTDDDVLPCADWLVRYEAIAKAHPEISIFAGQVRHHWMKTPPQWLKQLGAEGKAFAGTPENLKGGNIQAIEIKGPNFMVRREITELFPPDPSIGPTPSGNYIAGSETEFLLRAESAGYKMHFLPEASVHHIVKANQMKLRGILKRYYRIGRGTCATGVKTFPKDSPELLGIPRFVYRNMISGLFSSLFLGLKGDTYHAVRKLMEIASLAGRAGEWRNRKEF